MRPTRRDLRSFVPEMAGRIPRLRDLPLQRRRGLSVTSAAGIGVIGAGLGAVLMYLLDPRAGHRRRALARDKVTSLVRRSGAAVDGASRDVANRARGLVIEMRSRLGSREGAPEETAPGEAGTGFREGAPGDVTPPGAPRS